MNPPTLPCKIQPFPSRIRCCALLPASSTQTLKRPAGISPPPAPSHHLFIFIDADSLLWSKAIPSELPFQLSVAFVFNVGIFYLPCCLLSAQHCRQDVTEKPLLAERKPQPCQGTQTPDPAAFPCHHWCALCGSLMLLYSSLSEGSEVPMQQKMDLDNHRKQKKRIPRLRVSEKSLPWTLPQYLWQDRYWFHFSHSVYKLESNQNTVTCYKFCFALLQWLPVETVQALNRKR